MHRIGIDCRLAGSKHAGIGRYITELVRELLLEDHQVDWVLFFSDAAQANEVLAPIDKLHRRSTKLVYAPVRHYSIEEQVRMPSVFRNERLDLLHVPHFNVPLLYTGKIVVTIHDLLWHERQGTSVTTLPVWQYAIKHAVYKQVVAAAVRRAGAIFVPAKTIETAITAFYPSVKSKIIVTYEGANQSWTAQTVRPATQPPFLLYVGSLYPHKNIDVVLRALQENNRPSLKGLTLKIVGTRNVFADQVQELIRKYHLEDSVTLLGYQTDEQLFALLQTCLALVQPSLSEGFGLTGVEAMAAGAPVIASDIPIFHEIYQDAALFFDPKNPVALLEAATKLSSAVVRSTAQTHGHDVCAQYSWKKMTAETYSGYMKQL